MSTFILTLDQSVKILEQNFIIIAPLVYLVFKFCIKTFIRNLIEITNDYWEIFSWYSIDVAFITIAYCISKVLISPNPISFVFFILWFLCLILVTFSLGILYGSFIKRRKRTEKTPLSDRRLFFNITFSYFLSFGSLVLSYNRF